MKTQSVFFVCLCLLAGLVSCEHSPLSNHSVTSSLRRATGWPYEIVVVMDSKAWQDKVGRTLYHQLVAPIPALPQEEPAMRVSYSAPAGFDGFLKYVRNVLIVDINPSLYTKAGLSREKDKWATGQEVLYLKAPDAEQLQEYLSAHNHLLVDHFGKQERLRWCALLQKTHSSWIDRKAKERFGISLYVPEDMDSYKDVPGFLWVSNNANKGRTDLLVYTVPYVGPHSFSEDYLVAMRDSVLMQNLPGAFPDSYMATEKRFYLSYDSITYQGKQAGILRGLWKMVGDKMGGPFICHAFLDEKNQQLLMVEGFVYAPESKKANLIRKIEAALYTVRLPD